MGELKEARGNSNILRRERTTKAILMKHNDNTFFKLKKFVVLFLIGLFIALLLLVAFSSFSVTPIVEIIIPAWIFSFNSITPRVNNDDRHRRVASCSTDLDCSLNGVCRQSNGGVCVCVCVCDKPWIGQHCEILDFKPVKFPQGYGMIPNITTWGGGIIQDGDAVFHLFVSRMTNDCLLEDWTTNSRIDHAISYQGPEGPYLFHDIAINTFSHNPAPITLRDGQGYAVVHVGNGDDGPNGGKNCSSSTTDTKTNKDSSNKDEEYKTRNNKESSSNIHISKSLYGPWEPLHNSNLGKCNNPSPFIHQNGTIYVGCRGILKRANQIEGPYETIATFPEGRHDDDHDGPGPNGHYEDPQIYTDLRGNFHCLYHVYTTNLPSSNCTFSTVAAHAFSQDGYNWRISPFEPYGTQLEVFDTKNNDDYNGATTGTTTTKFITLATRERPKPLFNEEGVMTHVVQGVCGSPYCERPATNAGCVDCKYKQWDFTLVVPLNV